VDKLVFAEGIVRAIINKQHQFYVQDKGDDSEHITNIKRTIVAMSDYLKSEGLPKEDVDAVTGNLVQLCKDQYLEESLANRTDEDEKEVREESTIFFDYIYEHEEYPS